MGTNQYNHTMIKKLSAAILMAAGTLIAATPGGAATTSGTSPEFDKCFADSTLRVDYIFGGGPSGNVILLGRQSKTEGWAGRRKNLDTIPLHGNGQVRVKDPATGATLYLTSFSSLFQEWLTTDEAAATPRSFENTFILPLPKGEADIEITLFDNRREPIAQTTHRYSPSDELVAVRRPTTNYREYIHKGGDPTHAIDIAMVAEGYTEAERDSFLNVARVMANEILRYEPFASRKDVLNFIAVMPVSEESGVSVPLNKDWKETAVGSHFSTFHSARYLTAPDVWRLHDALNGVPYEHVMIIANTDRYGGGGIYNSYHIASAKNKQALPVTVHEFGHSFAGLADEYFYAGEESDQYPLDIEPWEPNITTRVDFASKWGHLIKPGTPIPTPSSDKGGSRDAKMKKAAVDKVKATSPVGLYEGGGYKAKGVYRPVETCRMRDNYHPEFCPVCQEAILKVIDFYTK